MTLEALQNIAQNLIKLNLFLCSVVSLNVFRSYQLFNVLIWLKIIIDGATGCFYILMIISTWELGQKMF